MKVKQITATVLVAVLVMATSAMAQGFGKSGCPGAKEAKCAGKGQMLDKLDLTEAQQAQVQAIRDEFREAKRSLIEKTHESRMRLQEAVHAPEYDEQAVRNAAAALAADEEELAVLRGQMFSRIRGVLTDEQLAKANEMRSQRQERRDCQMRCTRMQGNSNSNLQ